jgi:predicted PurR-regulated permease PerM
VFDTTYTLGKYALLIALIAGLLEAVPNIGPTITLIITLIIAIASGGSIPILIYIIIMFMLLQQIEALFLVPIVMKKAVNLHPIVSILGVLGGFSVAGVLGALLSMPVLSVFQIVFVEILKYYKDLENKNLHTT